MNVSRRNCQRIPVNLEAELVYEDTSCFAFIENISESGLYVKITCMDSTEDYKPDKTVNVKFTIPSGQFLDLLCKERWSNKNMSNSLIEQVGMKIIDPPEEYTYYFQSVSSNN